MGLNVLSVEDKKTIKIDYTGTEGYLTKLNNHQWQTIKCPSEIRTSNRYN